MKYSLFFAKEGHRGERKNELGILTFVVGKKQKQKHCPGEEKSEFEIFTLSLPRKVIVQKKDMRPKYKLCFVKADHISHKNVRLKHLCLPSTKVTVEKNKCV